MIKITFLEMAKQQCPNYAFDGCDNIMITDSLRLVRRELLQKCLLALKKRCDYFEECVAPMVNYISDLDKSKEYSGAISEYKELHHISEISRKCPSCDEPLPARKRFCAKCTLQRRQKANRAAVRRFRGLGVSS